MTDFYEMGENDGFRYAVREATAMPSVLVRPDPLTYAGPRYGQFDSTWEENYPFKDLLQPAKDGDAGVDLYAAVDVNILPGERVIVDTGISVAIPRGYEGQIRPRSGLAAKQGLTVVNTPGTIDAGYRGSLMIIALNTNPTIPHDTFDTLLEVLDGTAEVAALSEKQDLYTAERTIRIKRGDRIAQLVFATIHRPQIELVTELPPSDRGDGRFGSTELQG